VVTTFFNTPANLVYVGQIHDVILYGVDEMSASERQEFLSWYNREKVFDNRRVLEDYFKVIAPFYTRPARYSVAIS